MRMFARSSSLLLALALLGGTPSARAENGRHALFASYDTPVSKDGLGGREKILDFLVSRGFSLTLVTDRYSGKYPTREGRAIAPTAANLLSAIEDLAGDPSVKELAIFTDLHGEPPGKDELSHSLILRAPNHDALDPSDLLSMDLAAPAFRKLAARGAKVVWMDFSCHSGASLALADTGACIASAGNSEVPAWSNFIDFYAGKLKEGESFEQVFLATRRAYWNPIFPAISSAIGRELAAEEEQLALLYTDFNLGRANHLLSRGSWTGSEREGVKAGILGLGAFSRNALFAAVHGWGMPYDYLLVAQKSLPLVSAERAFYDRRTSGARRVSPTPADPSDANCRDFRF
jgi:hypothetical protein